jgi:hypothetical protein
VPPGGEHQRRARSGADGRTPCLVGIPGNRVK